MTATALELRDLTKCFANGVVALEPITLTIRAGEYFVLCGPSGAGKSTLLRLIAGLEQPTRGQIYFGTQEVQQWPPERRGVAWVPQRAALDPYRDVAGNILRSVELEQWRRPRRERLDTAEMVARVHQAATTLHITHLLQRRPDQLSGGEAKRVMLAKALVRRATLWLLDEPFGQLDGALAEKLSQELHLLQRLLSLTIIHVTHDPNEALALADRVGLLGGGRLLQTGTPSEIYAQPSSRTVGLHFGKPPIHFSEGVSDGTWFASADGLLRVPHPPQCGPLTLGVRAEDVVFTPQPGCVFAGEFSVQRVQFAGWRWLIETCAGRGWWEGLPPPEGTLVPIHLRVERLHWFDAFGQRVVIVGNRPE